MVTEITDPEPGTDFERRLRALLLESYATGETVEGSWSVTTPVADAPDWTVAVRRVDGTESPPYEPELLEE